MESALKQLNHWYKTPLGNCLREVEYAAITPYVQNCFGRYVLQIGGPGDTFLFHQNATFYPLRLSPERHCVFKGCSVRASFEALPFLPDSLGAVLLPHILEFTHDLDGILAQSHQVLMPEGRLLILGFNPWSLWGFYRYLICHQISLSAPWQGHFFSAGTIKKCLKQQGFVLEETQRLFFRPPVCSVKNLQRWMPLEALGRLLWADNGGIYLIVAKKQVTPLIPIKQFASPLPI